MASDFSFKDHAAGCSCSMYGTAIRPEARKSRFARLKIYPSPAKQCFSASSPCDSWHGLTLRRSFLSNRRHGRELLLQRRIQRPVNP